MRLLKPASAGIITVILLEALLRLFAYTLPPQTWAYMTQDRLMRTRSGFVYGGTVGHVYQPNQPYHLIDAYMLNDAHALGSQSLIDPTALPHQRIQTPFYTDHNGLINHEPLRESYSVVTVADSFGGYSAPVRWQDFLSVDYYDVSVSSWTFQNYVAGLEAFGYDKQPDRVILMIYGGNDLSGIRFEEARPLVAGSVLASVLRFLTYRGGVGMPLLVNGLPATLDIYGMGSASIRREDMEASQDFALATDILLDISTRVNLTIAYAPQRETVYWNHLSETDKRWAYDNLLPYTYTLAGGWLVRASTKPSYEDFTDHLQDQRDTWAAWASETGIGFVDLTPVLEGVIAGGVLPYNVVDTHWNPAGHEAVGRALGD